MRKRMTPPLLGLPLMNCKYAVQPGATGDDMLDDAGNFLYSAIDILQAIEDRQSIPGLFGAICLLQCAAHLVQIAPTEGATS
jgi:hypothetical protein